MAMRTLFFFLGGEARSRNAALSRDMRSEIRRSELGTYGEG